MDEDVKVTKNPDGTIEVTIVGKTVTLPAGSSRTEKTIGPQGNAQTNFEYGKGSDVLILNPRGGLIQLKKPGARIEDLYDGPLEMNEHAEENIINAEEALKSAWDEATGSQGGRRSRLKKQSGRTKRNRGGRKHRKLRKLTTRRR